LALPWTGSSCESVSRAGAVNSVLAALSGVLSNISYSTVVIVRLGLAFSRFHVIVL